MISGLLTLLLIATSASAEPPAGLDDLVSTLAEHHSSEPLQFREIRESALLAEPVVVSGQLWRDRHGRLIRHTVEPREETYRLGSGMVVIEQPGRTPRNFSLRRAPELAVLYRGLTALLAGDVAGLREHFEPTLEQAGESWQLRLVPRESTLVEQVESLTLSGRGSQFERSVMTLADGQTITTEISRQP